MSWYGLTYEAHRRGLAAALGRRLLLRAALAVGPVGILATLVLLLLVLGTAAVSAMPVARGALGIPAVTLSAYVAASARAPAIGLECAVDWAVVAGIWQVESRHGTTGGRLVSSDGVVRPPLYGPTLDGSLPGTRAIPDTDGGLLDEDPVWDRAVGPAQFLPATWSALGQDGDRDGVADPHNIFDAALATVAHLCLRSPGDYADRDDLARAVFAYNPSRAYVAEVLGWIDHYRAFGSGGPLTDTAYVFPLPRHLVTPEQIRRAHHDYPAADLPAPEGTPVYAAHGGTVARVSVPCADPDRCPCGWGIHVRGQDGHTYGYCHGLRVAPYLSPGATVAAGEVIMASGNTGRSSGPHLHFQIRSPEGALLCPQQVLEAWWEGIAVSPAGSPEIGCTTGGNSVP